MLKSYRMLVEMTSSRSNMFRTTISETRIPLATNTQILFVRTISVLGIKKRRTLKFSQTPSLTLQLFFTCRK